MEENMKEESMKEENSFQRCVWVSYSGADQSFVQTLVNHFEEHKDTKAVRLMAYMRDEETSVPIENSDQESTRTKMYLKAGESVTDLVEIIASTLRRMLVISPDYLTSEHCLWELASCFTLDSKVPICILKDISSFSAINQHRKYSFIDDANEYSLAEALAFVYQERVKKMHADFHLSITDEKDPVDFFENKIELLHDRAYVNVTLDNLNDNVLFGKIVEYVNSFKAPDIVANFEKFYKKLYLKWVKHAYAEECLKVPLVLNEEEDDETRELFELKSLISKNKDQITHLVKQLTNNLNLQSDTKSKDEAKAVIREFASLLALRMVNLTWASEFRMSSLAGVRLRFAVKEGVKESKKFFDCELAASVIQQVPVKVKFNRDGPKLDGPLYLKPLQCPPEQREANKKRQYDTLKETLVMLVMNYNKSKAKEFLTEPYWQEGLRARIFNEHRDQDGTLTVARLYVNHQKFQENLDEHWSELADSFINIINKGAEEERRVRIGTLIVSSRDEGNLIQFSKNHDLLFDHIIKLKDSCDDND